MSYQATKRHKGNFPGGPVVENLPANTGHMGLIPSLGKFNMLRGN